MVLDNSGYFTVILSFSRFIAVFHGQTAGNKQPNE
jgi:hypothetical protein